MSQTRTAVRRLALPLIMLLSLAGPLHHAARASGESIIAVAGDRPITQRDIDERIALLRILGGNQAAAANRKAILRTLVDDVVKLSEAKRLKVDPTDIEITKQIDKVSKGMSLSSDQLLAKLSGQGVSASTFRTYLQTEIGFNRIISGKYQGNFTVSPADVDRKMADIQSTMKGRIARIMKDPRMAGVTVYSLLEINLPVEIPDDIGLVQARAADAQQVVQHFKGCGSAKAAASGVFNVKIGKPVEADAAKLPPPMKSALDTAGVGHVIGPMRSKIGIQLLALCATRHIVPPPPKAQVPTRDEVQNLLVNEKFSTYEEAYLKTARKSVYVEYRDPAYAP